MHCRIFKRVIGFELLDRKSLVIGDSQSIDHLKNWVKRYVQKGFTFEGTFTTDYGKPTSKELVWLGNVEVLGEFLKKNKIHQIILLPNNKMENWISTVSDLGAKFGCRILVYNNLCGFFESRLVFVEESGKTILFIAK